MIPDERFPKEGRLVKTKDFRRLYKEAASFKMDGLILYCLAGASQKNRVGFSVPSKNIKLASRRNRLRRLLKEVYRKRKRYLKQGYDMVLVVKKDPARTVSYREIEETFLKLARKASLLV